MSIIDREEAILKTKEYIAQNLLIIKESEFNDSVNILLASNRSEMVKYVGEKWVG